MGFSTEPNLVRVDVWKPSGKWDQTLVLNWDKYHSQPDTPNKVELIHEIFHRCFTEQYPLLTSVTVTCLKPYHEHSRPLMIHIR